MICMNLLCCCVDFYGFLVSILAILVTTLIAFQIYQAIGFEKKIEVFKTNMDFKFKKHETKYRKYYNDNLGHSNFLMVKIDDIDKQEK